MNELPVYRIVVNEDDETGVDFISLVQKPAIKKDFLLFQEFVEPGAKESEDEFIGRCIPYMIGEGMEQDQAAAVCYDKWKAKLAGEKISIDYDDTLSTARGKELAKRLIAEGADLYIISARQDKEGMLSVATDLGIPASNVYATGSNQAKIAKIQELGIAKHYDNNPDVVKELGSIGAKFQLNFAVQSEEKRIITGPAMLANKPIYRHDDTRGEYYVTFDADTIWTIAKKIARKGSYSAVNTDHATPVNEGVHMIEMYFVNRERGINPPIGFEDAEDGSMFVSYLIDNEDIWQQAKEGKWHGFSVEGMFDIEYEGTVAQELRALTDSIKTILHQISKNNI